MVRSRAFAIAFALLCTSSLVAAGEPTAEQLKLFQQLSPEQQRALIQQATSGGSAPSTSLPAQQQAVAAPQPVAPRVSDVRRDSWREFDLRRLALEDPELESCLRRYEVGDLRAVRSVATDAGSTAVEPRMLPWDLRRRIGLLGSTFDSDRLTPGLDDQSDINESLRGTALWRDLWSCVDLVTQYDRTGGALRPFGYELFAGTPESFAPAVDIPVPADYLIGPGDNIDLQLFGKENAQHRLTVNRDGMIGLPGIGPVSVAGMSFERLARTIEQRVAQQTIGVRASVTMGPLRTMQVFVVGEAFRPGAYTVSSLATITHVLFAGGGIKPIGSLRAIELKRGGKTVRTLDLYDLLLRGDTSDDVRLQPGDAVFVPPVGATVAVAGEVRRPAIYEVGAGDTVADAIAIAGGLLPTAYPKATRLERIGAGQARSVRDVDASSEQGRKEKVIAGDYLRVYSMLERVESFVRVSGHVLRPGMYEWHPGLRLTELLADASALQPNPDLGYLLVRREVGPERRIEAFSIDIAQAWAAPGGVADPELANRDQVIAFGLEADRQPAISELVRELAAQASSEIPTLTVNVRGSVRSVGTYPLERGMTVSKLVRAAGGLSEGAYRFDAELTRQLAEDGKRRISQHIPVDLAALLAGDATKDLVLQPYDVLNLKPIPLWSSGESIVLRGEVRFPGTYSIKRGESLAEVIQRAGGLTTEAYPEGAAFTRVSLQRLEQEQIGVLARRLETDIATLALSSTQSNDPQAQEALLVGRSLVAQMRTVQAPGRLVIDLPALMAGSQALELQGGDRLIVPRKPSSVTVIGEIQYPTSHLYEKGEDLTDYISKSGGFTQKANDDAVYVVRANGRVDVGSAAKEIRPGDTIVVPLDTERMRPLVFWSTVTQILFQLGLFLASAHTIGVL